MTVDAGDLGRSREIARLAAKRSDPNYLAAEKDANSSRMRRFRAAQEALKLLDERAQSIFDACDGDHGHAVEGLLDAVEDSVFAAKVAPAMAFIACTEAIKRAKRTVPIATTPQNSRSEAVKAFVKANGVVRLSMMAWRLPNGVELQNARKRDLLVAVHDYEVEGHALMAKARWLRLIAAKLSDDKMEVKQSLTAAQIEAMRIEARAEWEDEK